MTILIKTIILKRMIKMTKYTDEDLIVNEKLREELMSRVDVLKTVKEIALLPNTELVTTKMVADYYEVSEDVVRDNIRRNREELETNGAKTLSGDSLREMKSLSGIKSRARSLTFFTIRATLNLGMLLRDSKVAQEVRNQLLNGFERLSDKQKTQSIDDEEALLFAVIKAKNPTEQAIAVGNLNIYHNRHKEEMNARIDEMKPKEEAFDTFMDAKNFQRMNDVAKSVGYGRNKLFAFLRDKKILMKCNTPYQTYIERGWFVVRQRTVEHSSYYKNYAQTFVTAKGTEAIAKLLREEGLID